MWASFAPTLRGTHFNDLVWAEMWAVRCGVSPGGVHASTEDWTNTDRLLEGIGIFLSLYLAKAAWTASVCKSKRTHRDRLAAAEQRRTELWKISDSTDTITGSEAFIPGVRCSGLVVFRTWEGSLRRGLNSVINLQRRVYTCRKDETQRRHKLKQRPNASKYATNPKYRHRRSLQNVLRT